MDLDHIDVDMSWAALQDEVAPLFHQRAFAVLLVELDNNDRPQAAALDKLVCLAHRHSYATLLKVPCAGSGRMHEVKPRGGAWQFPVSHRAAYLPISGRYYQPLPRSWGTDGRAPCAGAGGQHCNVQDVLVIDTHMHELRGLIDLGNRECGTAFPADLTPKWAALDDGASAQLAGLVASPPVHSLVGEREVQRPTLWRGSNDKRQLPQAAKLLPDGTWSCTVDNSSAPAPRCKT